MKYLLGQTHPCVTSQRYGSLDPNRHRNTSFMGLTGASAIPSGGCSEDYMDDAAEYPAHAPYVPGRYLRWSPHINDTYLWPEAAGSRRCDGATASQLADNRRRDDQDACLSFNTSQSPPSLPLTRCQSSILVAACLVIAIIGLGGLTTVI